MLITKKIKRGKIFLLLWLVLILAFGATFGVTYSKYSHYKKGQDYAFSIMVKTQDKFHNAKPGPDTVKSMYQHLQYYFHSIGYVYREVDKSIGKMLTEEGYTCYYASDYLKYTNYFDYTSNKNEGGLALYGLDAVLLFVLLFFNLKYLSSSKKTMVVEADCISAYKGKKNVKQFLIKDIKSVDACASKGLKIRGAGFKYKIKLVKNRDEIRTSIMEKMQQAHALVSQTPAAAESSCQIKDIREFKELLDLGIITQEEFDAKKKQLLGL